LDRSQLKETGERYETLRGELGLDSNRGMQNGGVERVAQFRWSEILANNRESYIQEYHQIPQKSSFAQGH
jgi:hypothetical protein